MTVVIFQEEVLDRISLIERHAEELGQIDVPNTTDQERLAFWRASKGNIKKAKERLQTTIEWRSLTNIENLLRDPKWRTKEHAMRKVLWYDYLGVDKHGRPILVERVGRWDVKQVLNEAKDQDSSNNKKETTPVAGESTTCTENNNNETEEDRFLKLHCMACETLLKMSQYQYHTDTAVTSTHSSNNVNTTPSIKDTRGQIVIMDLEGLSTWHLDPRLARAFGRLARNDAEHYPDTLAHIWVINAPFLFQALSKLITPFLDRDTASKVHVSSTVPKELVECVGEDCLPIELGGKRIGIFPYDESAPLSDHPRQRL